MDAYDINGSGSLDQEELVPMLKDYSEQILGEASTPTRDDVEFLISLCEISSRASQSSKLKARNIDQPEILAVLQAANNGHHRWRQ